MNAATKISAVGISKWFDVRADRRITAIQNLNMEIETGSLVALLGPSGCGKSTFLYMIAGFVEANSGVVKIDGIPVKGPGSNRGLVFQEYTLFPWRTIEANVRFGLDVAHVDRKTAAARCKELIDLVGLKGFETSYPHELSGDMQQRTSIARALAYDPDILLMDEPFGALDAQTKRRLIDDVTRIWQATGKTIVFVTHSVEEALLLADKVVLFGARPSSVRAEFKVDMPRPRSLSSPDFVRMQAEILEMLDGEVAKMM